MNFIEWGAFSFLALIPVVILLYLLKLKRKPVFVSSTFLWMQAVKDSKADAPFQKLTRNLLLILQLLALLSLIFVKARPYFKTSFQGGHHSVLILDNSASMQAVDAGKSRFSQAQNAALKLIEQMKERDQMMIISVNSRSNIETVFTENKGTLSKAVKSLKSLDSTTSIRDALVLAISSLKNYNDGKIFLLSDGCFGKVEDLGPSIPPISFISFGDSSDNVGITNMNLRANPFSSEEIDILVEITNFSKEKKDFLLELYLDKKLIDAHKVSMKTGERKWEVFQGIVASSGILMVKSNVEDALSVDNIAYGVITAPTPMNILLVSDGNVFLEHFLRLTPGVNISEISSAAYNPEKKFDLVIFDGGNIAKIGSGNFIFWGTNISLKSFEINGEVKKPLIISWDKQHPVLRFVDFSDVHIAKAFKITIPANGKSLVDSKETPIICSIIEENFKSLFIGFTLYNSDIILRPAFPILLSNALQWFNPSSFEVSGGQIKTGEPIKIANYVDTITVTDPLGNKTELDRGEKKDIYFSNAFITGIYTVQHGKEKHYIAANLLDDAESNITPVKTLSISGTNIGASQVDRVVQKEFWKVLAFLALIILTWEWYIFHKRVT